MSDEGFISRWSRRKTESKAASPEPVEASRPVSEAAPAEPPAATPLPPVESLTPESDFTPFMKSDVNPATRRQAMKMLFQDPRFNVMDGLDTYIDDYSKPDPLPPGWLEQMTQMARLGEYREPEPDTKPVPETLGQSGMESAHSPPDTPDGGSQPPPMAKSMHHEGAEEDSSGVDFPHNKAEMPRTPND